jgi:hypothetical protein
MLAIGRIIKKMDLEFNIMKMVTSMKVDGLKTRGIIKELCGLLMERTNLEDNILGIGKKIKRKEEVLCFSKMVIDMMDFGLMINLMDKEE